jgi:formate dehydrogenase major subunit
VLYDTSKHVMEGGGNFRANFGTERDGETCWPRARGPRGRDPGRLPAVHRGSAQAARLVGRTDAEEKVAAEGKAVDHRPVRRHHPRRDEARLPPLRQRQGARFVWNFPDPVPMHREPLYTPRYDLVADYPTYEDRKVFYRLPTRWKSVQARDYSGEFPLIHTSGRLVEYEGGGEETRSNPWLAELKQDMFVEINPADANDANVRDGQTVWLEGPEGGRIRIKALVTNRVEPRDGVHAVPLRWALPGQGSAAKYPEGSAPYVRGESTNTATTYGYDAVTMMQETKTTLDAVVVPA